jgi:serine/threonine-protein kinase
VRPRGLSLTLKIFLGTALVVVVIVGVTLAVAARSATTAADESVNRVLGSAREAVSTQLAARAESMRGAAEIFVTNPQFRALVESRRLSSVLDQANVAEASLDASWVQIVDAEGVRMAKSDEPGAPADTLASSSVIGSALSGEPVVAFGVTGDSVLIQVTAVPIEGAGRIVGALMAAKAVDSAFAAAVKRQAATDVDVVFSLLDQNDTPLISGSTLGRSPDVSATLAAFHAAAGDSASDARVETEIGGTHFVGLGDVLRSAGGAPLGGFLMLRDRDAEFASFARLQQTILLSGAIGIFVAALLSLLLARQITRPLARLVEATKRATDGDYAAQIPLTSRDEIGILAGAFRALLADLREKQQLVEFLSSADDARTVQIKTLSITSEQRALAGGLKPGAKFAGRYEVKEVLGEGGMGTVFRAVDSELHEVIAIKTLKKDFLSQDPTALERFKEEIRLARRISHRNVVRTHDLGENSGVYYITMEYVEGTSLKELIRARGRLPLNITLSVGKQLARALEVAHEQGIIHRDIKPQNIAVEADGVLKVMDFGIARLAARKPESGMTQAGTVVGTPEYMAPEQLSGGSVDQRVDIYAAGCVLYECLTGQPPITGETPYQVIARLLEDTPEPPGTRVAGIPPALDALIVQTLSKDPALRPQTALILHDRLAAIG